MGRTGGSPPGERQYRGGIVFGPLDHELVEQDAGTLQLARQHVGVIERGSQDSNLESPVLETGALASWATAPERAMLPA